MFLARAAARHVLINAPSHSTSFDNEAGRSIRLKGLGPTFGCKVHSGRGSVEGGNNYSLMWETRWCDAAARLSQLHSFLLRGCQILSSPCVMQSSTDGLEKCATSRATAARICALVRVWALHISALVCLSFFLPPHDIKTLAGKTGLTNAGAGTEHTNADKVGQESTTRMFWLEACVCVCEYVWPVSYIFGVKIFSCTDKNKIKNKKQKGFRSCLEGLAKESSADQYKILELQLKIIDSLPIRVFPKA